MCWGERKGEERRVFAHLCPCECQCLQILEKGMRSLGAGITGGCSTQNGCWDQNSGPARAVLSQSLSHLSNLLLQPVKAWSLVSATVHLTLG